MNEFAVQRTTLTPDTHSDFDKISSQNLALDAARLNAETVEGQVLPAVARGREHRVMCHRADHPPLV